MMLSSTIHGLRPVAAVLGVLLAAGAASAAPKTWTASKAPLSWSAGAPGKGGIVAPKTFCAARDVKVYRVWDGSAGKAGQWGKYWTDFPIKSLGELRNKLAVCPEWNAGLRVTSCTLPKGTKVVRGRGQTATCAGGKTLRGGPVQTVIFDADKVLRGCKSRPFAPAVKAKAAAKGKAKPKAKTNRPKRKAKAKAPAKPKSE